MVRVVEHPHHDDDDVEMTEGMASSAPRASRLPAPGATVPVEQPPSARVWAPVKGPLTSCERRSDKSQLAAYLTHVRKPAPAES